MSVIRYDLFPAIVTITPGDTETEVLFHEQTFQIHASRAIVFDDRILVVIDNPRGPLPVFDQPADISTYNKENRSIKTSTGAFVSIEKDDSCGCGSRLRSWNPYNHVTYRA